MLRFVEFKTKINYFVYYFLVVDPKNSHGMLSTSSIFIAVVCSLVIVAAIIFISAFIWKRSRGMQFNTDFFVSIDER